MRYLLVQATDPESLCTMVDEKLEQGFELLGGVAVAGGPFVNAHSGKSTGLVFYQAMTSGVAA